MPLGEKIMYLRKEKKGFQRRQLFVNEIKTVSYSYIWEIESGVKKDVPDEILEVIAKVLEVPVAILK